MPTDATPTLSAMRATFTGEPAIFPDLGPFELVSGDIVELPDGAEDEFLRRGDFQKAKANATLTDLSARAPLLSPDIAADEPVPASEPEATAPEDDALKGASAGS